MWYGVSKQPSRFLQFLFIAVFLVISVYFIKILNVTHINAEDIHKQNSLFSETAVSKLPGDTSPVSRGASNIDQPTGFSSEPSINASPSENSLSTSEILQKLGQAWEKVDTENHVLEKKESLALKNSDNEEGETVKEDDETVKKDDKSVKGGSIDDA